MFSKKYFFGGVTIGFILLISYIFSLPDNKLHITFCDVGQGDAIYIKFPNNSDMLIDGGPDDKVLMCLGKHMAFYDRYIDVVILTHPQKDHLQGLVSVIKRYSVKYFVIGVEGNDSEGYRQLISIIKDKNIKVKNLFEGDRFSMGETQLNVLWPKREWVESRINNYESGMLNAGTAVLGVSTDTELNDFSYYLLLKYGDFEALFPGDGDIHIQPEVLREDLPHVSVLKVPHHGSKTAMMEEFLEKIKPEVAVISVGKNSYGHPTEEAINLLKEIGSQIKRTDVKGDIEMVSDGKGWGVE